MKKLYSFFVSHKIVSLLIIVALAGGGFWAYKAFYKKPSATSYVAAKVEKGMLISSISGSGQIVASDEADLKTKASGDIVYFNLKKGDEVRKGELLLQLDITDAQQTVKNAEIALKQQQLALDKLKGMTTDEGTILGSKEKARADLDKTYEDGFNTVANVFLDLPSIMSGLNNILLGYGFSSSQWNMDYYANTIKDLDEKVIKYRDDAYSKYQTARTAYDENFQDYKTASRLSDSQTIESLISETYDSMLAISEAVKSANNLVQFYQDTLTTRGYTPQTLSNTHLTSLNSYTSKTNSYLVSLLSTKTTIQNEKEAIIESSYDISDQEIQVEKAQGTLNEAKKSLEDYYVYAPFDGIISNVNIKKRDTLGNGTTVCTLITKNGVAELSLSEVDVPRVKAGQKATVTFDAIEDLTMSGVISDVDTMGTTSSGVVSYTATIAFDTYNDQVKAGMSVSASIITDTKQDVLFVPTTAVKTKNGQSYVLVLNSSDVSDDNITNGTAIIPKTAPTQQEITVGISSDTSTEITSGLKEGDIVVAKTVTKKTANSNSSSSSNSDSSTKSILQTTTGSNRNAGAVMVGPPGGF